MKQFLAINHHANACKGSQIFANHLINYTYFKLLANAAEADFPAIIAFYKVFVDIWNEGYIKYRAAFNASMGATRVIQNLNKELVGEKAPTWVVKIWGIYREGSVDAIRLIPHGRGELIKGPYFQRLSAMNTLIEAIGDDNQLADLKLDLQTFAARYDAGIKAQLKAQKLMSDLSKEQEVLRLSTTSAMLGVEGKLTDKYYMTPDRVDGFFDIGAMRRRNAKSITPDGFQIMLLPVEIKLLQLRYDGTEIWKAENPGMCDICLFFSNNSDESEIPEVKYIVSAGQSITIDLKQIPSDQRFVYAANLSREKDGMLIIYLSA